MKRKLILLCVFILSIIALLGITAFAEEEEEFLKEITIEYYESPTSLKASNTYYANVDTDGDGVLDGYKETLKSQYGSVPSGKKFFGWYDQEGVFYDPSKTSTVVFTEDVKLYQFVGKESDKLTGMSFGAWGTECIRLTKDLTLSKSIDIPDGGILVLDLNGHNITCTADYFANQRRAGLIIVGKGTINHSRIENGVEKAKDFYRAEYHFYGPGLQLFWIGKDVTIKTPGALWLAANSMSDAIGLPNIRIFGTTTSRVIASARGTSSATLDIYPTANITIKGSALYEDLGTLDDRILIRLTIHGGNISVPSEADGFVNFVQDYNDDIHDFEIYGGTFNRDIQKLISTDYRCAPNGDGTYSVTENKCPSLAAPDAKHDYIIESLTVTCEEAGTITFECLYCGDHYTLERDALEHTFVSVQTTQPVSNRTETLPGVREQYCSRCTQTTKEYFYLDPAETYVTVKVRQNNITETIRVKGKVLFGFNQHGKLEGKTRLSSYAVSRFDYTYSDGTTKTFKKEEIISVEIPLGTTCIAGGVYSYTNTPLGAFYNQDAIEEVILPMSLIDIESHAFRDMDNLKSVKGLEYDSETGKMVECSAFKNVTGDIKDSAFRQDELSRLSFDNVEFNANTIEANAFRNCPMKTVYFGKGVSAIGDAFICDSNLAFFTDKDKEIKEVFFETFTPEKYPGKDGVTVETAHEFSPLLAKKSGKELESNTIKKAKIYYDHTYDVVVHEPNCLEVGYTGYECIRCGYGTKSNFVSNQGITHEWELDAEATVASTCTTQGFTAEMCHKCGSKRASDYLPLDPNNHTYTLKAPEQGACTKRFWRYVRVCECGDYLSNSYLSGVTQTPLNPDHEKTGEEFYDIYDQVKVTCGADGYTVYKCKYCSHNYREDVTATGNHRIAKDENKTTAPTCSVSGKNVFYCTNGCGYEKVEHVDKLKGEAAKEFHVYTDWTVIQQPTTEITGFRQRICTLCGTPETEIINTLVKETFWTKLDKMWTEKPWFKAVVIGGIVLVVSIIIALVVYVVLFRKAGLGRKFKYGFEKTSDEKMSKKEQRMWKKKIKKVKKQK